MLRRVVRLSLAISLFACGAADTKLDDGFGEDGNTGDTGDGTGDGTEEEEEEEIPVDSDGDGYVEEDDCDDEDPDTHPDAEELDDGIDNDCNDYVDDVSVCVDTLADYETIQDAIDGVPDDWTVLVCAGEYEENIRFNGKTTTVIGIDGAESTIVRPANDQSPVVAFVEADGSKLAGFTVTGGQAENGAGIVVQGCEITLEDNIIVDNHAANNGGGMVASQSEVWASGNVFADNTAGNYGGGLLLQDSSGEFSECVFEGNQALEGGGVFSTGGDPDFIGNEFVGNHATTTDESAWGPGGGGGAMWMYGSGTVADNHIHENHSDYHAGGAYFYYGTVEFTGNTVADNTSGEDGAGVYFSVSSSAISDNVFEGNAAYDDGGGLRLYYGSCTIEGNRFIGNTAGDDGGGAKFSHSEHLLSDNYFEGNSTGDAGGGLELDNDSTHTIGNTFVGNFATRGAGLHNWRTEASFDIEGNTFDGNVASDCGGAMSFDNSPYWIRIHHNILTFNEAMDGGGICVDMVYRDPDDVGGLEEYYQDTYLDISNTVLSENVAYDDGGGLYVKAGAVNLSQSVVDDNYGGSSGAIATKGSPVYVSNSIFYDNDGGAVALAEDDIEGESGSIDWRYSAFYDNDGDFEGVDAPSADDGNIDADPVMTEDWELESDSPCIDTGDPAVLDADGSRSDMGAFGGPDGDAW